MRKSKRIRWDLWQNGQAEYYPKTFKNVALKKRLKWSLPQWRDTNRLSMCHSMKIITTWFQEKKPKHTPMKTVKLEQPSNPGQRLSLSTPSQRSGCCFWVQEMIREWGRRLQSWQPALLAGVDGNDALIGTECEASETWEGQALAALLITQTHVPPSAVCRLPTADPPLPHANKHESTNSLTPLHHKNTHSNKRRSAEALDVLSGSYSPSSHLRNTFCSI